MKKSILLSTVVSSVLFGGGDITSVGELHSSSADFWGMVGFSYQFQDDNSFDFKDKENNQFSSIAVIGVENHTDSEGFGFGAEVASWSDFGFDIADSPRVEAPDQTGAEVSQAYLTFTTGNSAFKAGRQALPKAVSPWAWTDRTSGVLDWTFDGLVVANADLADTTLVGAWIIQASHNRDVEYHVSDSSGLFMLGIINRSVENTTIVANAYYVPDSKLNNLWSSTLNSYEDTWSGWISIVQNSDICNWGVQGAYVDGDVDGWNATYAISAKIGSNWNDLSAELIASYINDGDYSLRLGGSGAEDSALWSDQEMAGDTYGANQWAFMGKFEYSLDFGKLYGSIAYYDYDTHKIWGDEDRAVGMRVGYKFAVVGIDTKVEYRYRDIEYYNSSSQNRQRVRIEAFYRF